MSVTCTGPLANTSRISITLVLIKVLVSAYRTLQTSAVTKTWEDRHMSSDTLYSVAFTTTIDESLDRENSLGWDF